MPNDNEMLIWAGQLGLSIQKWNYR
jgi:hypothetical protein